jgi:hypothetical protein
MASMACEGGSAGGGAHGVHGVRGRSRRGGGAVSDDRRKGCRPVRARSSAPAPTPARDLQFHVAPPPRPWLSTPRSMERDMRPRPSASAGATPASTAATAQAPPRARPRLRRTAGRSRS